MQVLQLILPTVLLSFLLTGVATWYSKRRGLLDLPGERHSHSEATPRGGGAGLLLAFLLSIAVVPAWLPGTDIPPDFSRYLLIGLAVMGLVGWWDDHHDLSARFRFAVQLAVSVFLVSSLMRSGWIAGWAHAAVAVLFVAWMINLYNFMDGSNGMAAFQGVFATAVLAWLFSLAGDKGASVLAMLLMASCLGFIPWNLGRARVFMGDVGSLALGYGIAALLLYGVGTAAFNLPVALMVMALFLADSSLTLLHRVLKGERWYNAHRQHLYQRIIAMGWTHGGVLILYQLINLLLVLPGIVIGVNHPDWAWATATVLGLVLGLGWFLSITRMGELAQAG